MKNMKTKINLFVDNRTCEKIEDIEGLEEIAAICLLEDEVIGEYELSLSFVTREEIQSLNKSYRNKDMVTDVLSFPTSEDFLDYLLGDVVICIDRAREQANEFNHSLEREIVYLYIHSIFHLLGYDHETEEDKMEMREKEKAVIRKIGVFKSEG